MTSTIHPRLRTCSTLWAWGAYRKTLFRTRPDQPPAQARRPLYRFTPVCTGDPPPAPDGVEPTAPRRTRLCRICAEFARSEPGGRAEPAPVGSRGEDLADLGDHPLELLVGVEVVRPEPDPRVRPEVADDLALAELLVNRLEVGDEHGDRPAAPRRVARGANLEAGLVREPDQQVGLAKRVRADPLHADLLDEVVA